jgi:hypothetical protein
VSPIRKGLGTEAFKIPRDGGRLRETIYGEGAASVKAAETRLKEPVGEQ